VVNDLKTMRPQVAKRCKNLRAVGGALCAGSGSRAGGVALGRVPEPRPGYSGCNRAFRRESVSGVRLR